MSPFCAESKCSVRLIPCNRKMILVTLMLLVGVQGMIDMPEDVEDVFAKCQVEEEIETAGKYEVLSSHHLLDFCPKQCFTIAHGLKAMLHCEDFDPTYSTSGSCSGTLMAIKEDFDVEAQYLCLRSGSHVTGMTQLLLNFVSLKTKKTKTEKQKTEK